MLRPLSESPRAGGTVVNSEIGVQIRQMRVKAGFSQARLAQSLQISTLWISRIENGRGRPSEGLVRRMSEALAAPHILAAFREQDHELVPFPEPCPGQEFPQQIPIVGKASCPSFRFRKPGQAKTSKVRRDYLSFFLDPRDPDAYALIVTCDCMSPIIREGDVVVGSPRAKFRSGDEAIVTTKRGTSYMRIVVHKGDMLLLKVANDEHSEIILKTEDVLAINKIVAIRRKP